MTVAEYRSHLEWLRQELEAAIESGDENRVLGTKMAIKAFLECVSVPAEGS